LVVAGCELIEPSLRLVGGRRLCRGLVEQVHHVREAPIDVTRDQA